ARNQGHGARLSGPLDRAARERDRALLFLFVTLPLFTSARPTPSSSDRRARVTHAPFVVRGASPRIGIAHRRVPLSRAKSPTASARFRRGTSDSSFPPLPSSRGTLLQLFSPLAV